MGNLSNFIILHSSLSNYWTVNTNASNFWLANKLIKMQGKVYTWIKLRIGNGVNCRFLIDNWSVLRSLKNYFAATSSSRQGIPLRASLSYLNKAGNWIFPQPRSNVIRVDNYITGGNGGDSLISDFWPSSA